MEGTGIKHCQHVIRVISMIEKKYTKIKKEKIAYSFIIPKIVSQMFKETRDKKITYLSSLKFEEL